MEARGAVRKRNDAPAPVMDNHDDIWTSMLSGKDKDHRYAWAAKNLPANHFGVGYFLRIGWSIVRHGGFVKLDDGQEHKDGDPVEMDDMVLISIPVEVWEKNQEYGHRNGGLGMQHRRRVQDQINAGADPHFDARDVFDRQGSPLFKFRSYHGSAVDRIEE